MSLFSVVQLSLTSTFCIINVSALSVAHFWIHYFYLSLSISYYGLTLLSINVLIAIVEP